LRVDVDPRRDPAETLSAYVRSLRRRALALYAVRASCAAVGAASLALVVIGSFAGPVVTPLFARVALGLLVALAAAILVMGLWPLSKLRGPASTRLLGAREPVLASRLRSALELGQSGVGLGSEVLAAAYARSVSTALAAVPSASIVPLRVVRHPIVIVGLGVALVAGCALLVSDSARSGAQAMLSPAHVRGDGIRVAPVIGDASATLVFPTYLNRRAERIADPVQLEAPRGTTVELLLTPRLPARQGSVYLGGTPIRMSAAPNGKLFARFVVRESAPFALRLHSGRHWYEDSTRRSVKAIADQKPTAKLAPPLGGTTVEAESEVRLQWNAGDDHALQVVELVIRSQYGEEQRRRLWSSVGADKPQRSLDDELSIAPVELGARPGDVLLLWLEAKDGDVVSGPNVGISKSVSLEVATDAQQLSLKVPLLREVLDGALDSLADRLETALPEQSALAQQRVFELRQTAEAWLSRLQSLIGTARKQPGEGGVDVDQLQGVFDRMRRELGREAAAYRGGTRATKAWHDADARVIAEHERDVLLLSEMLAQALVDEARALTQELAGLKQHIGELLQKIKAQNSPEAQRELLAEIAKAQRRLRELAQSLARLSNRVPSEFINREALPQSEASSALDGMRAAVESGDLDSAERQLALLDQEIDQLAEQIESGGNRFREAHFGERDRALAAARQELGQLTEEQARLSERTRELLDRTSDRAESRAGENLASEEMQRAADELQREIDDLHESDRGSAERPWLERARDRMRDAADAMRTGDLAEARRMAQAASGTLEQAAASIEQDARMFPGHRNETWERASAANAAADKLRKLEQQLDRSLPRLGEFVGDGERRQMRGDVDPQRRAREKAGKLSSDLGRGPEGMPLSPQGERELQQASEAMRRAERALERGDPQAAALAQDEASERLRQLDEDLRQKGRGSGQRPQMGERRDGGGEGMSQRAEAPVRIPGADEFSGPVQMRRKLLDAMREPAPSDYEGAVERYYEELLR
jgi:gas vesicle protein